MSDHPSRDALGRYRAGDLPPAELLAIDAHLAQCAECRAHGLAGLDTNRELRAALASSHATHLDYELLEAYTDGLLGTDERDAVESHLSLCETCSEDVGDLRRIRAELSLEAASSLLYQPRAGGPRAGYRGGVPSAASRRWAQRPRSRGSWLRNPTPVRAWARESPQRWQPRRPASSCGTERCRSPWVRTGASPASRPASRRSCASAPKPRCRAGGSPNLPLSTIYVGLLAP